MEGKMILFSETHFPFLEASMYFSLGMIFKGSHPGSRVLFLSPALLSTHLNLFHLNPLTQGFADKKRVTRSLKRKKLDISKSLGYSAFPMSLKAPGILVINISTYMQSR